MSDLRLFVTIIAYQLGSIIIALLGILTYAPKVLVEPTIRSYATY